MTNHCPDCGAEVDYERQEIEVRVGSCRGCGHNLTLLGGGGLLASTPKAVGTGVASQLTCESCGSPLMLESDSAKRIIARCVGCAATHTFVRADRLPPRFTPENRGRPGREGPGPGPRARPCRECGGPLSFSTNEDGTVSARCASCGNEFTLPPRRDQGYDRRGYRGTPLRGRRDGAYRETKRFGRNRRERKDGGWRGRPRYARNGDDRRSGGDDDGGQNGHERRTRPRPRRDRED